MGQRALSHFVVWVNVGIYGDIWGFGIMNIKGRREKKKKSDLQDSAKSCTVTPAVDLPFVVHRCLFFFSAVQQFSSCPHKHSTPQPIPMLPSYIIAVAA